MIRKQEKLNQKHKHARKSRHDGANNGSDGQAIEGCGGIALRVCSHGWPLWLLFGGGVGVAGVSGYRRSQSQFIPGWPP
ncbi:hypothetical protein [Cutibacterium acnes]|uniref:hypothetical protein n=1 Tax=Cutibacterium acnes TaxID=1747 RepID=UPI00223842C2|nr:hypothetical protein [Cutibacterium acnes]